MFDKVDLFLNQFIINLYSYIVCYFESNMKDYENKQNEELVDKHT